MDFLFRILSQRVFIISFSSYYFHKGSPLQEDKYLFSMPLQLEEISSSLFTDTHTSTHARTYTCMHTQIYVRTRKVKPFFFIIDSFNIESETRNVRLTSVIRRFRPRIEGSGEQTVHWWTNTTTNLWGRESCSVEIYTVFLFARTTGAFGTSSTERSDTSD